MPEVKFYECKNCGEMYDSKYCPNCGQEHIEENISSKAIIKNYFDDVFGIDENLFRTIKTLLFKPGQLTIDFIKGKRARYLAPFKLYLLLALLYYFSASLINSFVPKVQRIYKKIDQETFVLQEEEKEEEKNVATEDKLDIQAEFEEDDGVKVKDGKLLLNIPNHGEVSIDLDELKNLFKSSVQSVLIFLLPVTALIYKMFYRQIRFSEHLIFAIHNSCFLFLLSTINQLLEWIHPIFDILMLSIIPIYFAVSFKNFTKQSWFKIIFKGNMIFNFQLLSVVLAYSIVGISIFAWLFLYS